MRSDLGRDALRDDKHPNGPTDTSTGRAGVDRADPDEADVPFPYLDEVAFGTVRNTSP